MPHRGAKNLGSNIRFRATNEVDENHPAHQLESLQVKSVSAERLAAPVKLAKQVEPTKKKGQYRDYEAEFAELELEVDGDAWEAQEAAAHYTSVKAASTLRIEAGLRRSWILFQTIFRKVPLADVELSLTRGAPPPNRGIVLVYIRAIARKGKSRFVGKKGWSYRTILKALFHFIGMLASAGVGSFPPDDIDQMRKGIQNWCYALDRFHTETKKRFILRPTDYDALMAGIFSPAMTFETNFQRIQFAMIVGLLWETGARTGAFVEPYEALGLAHCVRLGDCDLVYTGRSEWGAEFELFMVFQYSKGMKLDRSQYTQQHIRSLPGNLALIDCLLPFMATTIANKVWDYDLLPLVLGTCDEYPQAPFRIPLKQEFKTTSITKAGVPSKADKSRRNQYQPESMKKPDPQVYAALTHAALSKLIQKVQELLNWPDFIGKALRYTWSHWMLTRIPREVYIYQMGHRANSTVGVTDYQPPDRIIDLTSARHDLPQQNTDYVSFRNSVSYHSDKMRPAVVNEEVAARMKSPEMKPFVERFSAQLARFEASLPDAKLPHGKKFVDYLKDPDSVPDPHKSDFDITFDLHGELQRRYNYLYHKEIHAYSSCDDDSVLDELAPNAEEARPVDEDDVTLPPEVEDSIETAVGFLASTHPLLTIAMPLKYRNARANLVQHYLKMIREDDIFKQKKCPLCIEADNLEITAAQSHRDLSQHLWSCEKKRFLTKDRCNFCGDMINADDTDFVSHVEECCIKHYRKLVNESTGYPLSHQIRIYGGHLFKVFFCPWCLHLGNDWDMRSNVTTGANHALVHLLSHLKQDEKAPKDLRLFSSAATFTCWFPSCKAKNMTAVQMINHLYSAHKYPLLTCVCTDGPNHDHRHGHLTLEESNIAGRKFLFESDLALIKKHPNGREYYQSSQVCIVNAARKKATADAAAVAITAFLDSLS